MEDVALSKTLKRVAGRPACLRSRVTTSGRRWETHGPWRTIFTMWRLRARLRAGRRSRGARAPLSMSADAAAPLLLVFAKAPVPGAVKTRLAAAIGAERAARRSIATCSPLRLRTRTAAWRAGIVVADRAVGAPDRPMHPFSAGSPPPSARRCIAQGEGDLGARMAHAIADALNRAAAVLLIGTDCPLLDSDRACRKRARCWPSTMPCWARPRTAATSWSGAPAPLPFDDVRWSTPHALGRYRQRALPAPASATRCFPYRGTWTIPPTLPAGTPCATQSPVTDRMKPKLLFLFPDGWDEAAFAAVSFAARRVRRRLRRLRSLPLPGEREHPLVRRAPLDRAHGAQAIATPVSPASRRPTSNTARCSRPSSRASSACPEAIRPRSSAPSTSTMREMRALPRAARGESCLRPPALRVRPHVGGDGDPGLPFPFFVKPVKAAFSVLARRVDDARRAAAAPHVPSVGNAHHQAPGAPVRRSHAAVRSEFTVDPEHMLRRGAARRRADQRRRLDGSRRRRLFRHRRRRDVPGHARVPALRVPVAPAGIGAGRRVRARRARDARGGRSTMARSTSSCSGSPRTNRLPGHRDQSAPRRAVRRPLREGRRHAIRTRSWRTCPSAARRTGRAARARFGAAASFVFREFNGAIKIAPDKAQIDWLGNRVPGRRAAHLHQARQQPLARDQVARQLSLRDRQSGRRRSREDLERRYDEVCRNVSFEAGSKVRFAPDIDSLRPGR